MNDLTTTHQQLREALAPLGIEIGRDVLALWRDRECHGQEPLPDNALRHLADLATRLLAREPP
jgi:hypothetical protein